MKILCFTDSLGSGGAQRQLVNLGIYFKEQGNEVSFLIYHPDFFYKEILIKNGIEIELLKSENIIKRIFFLRKYIQNGKFTVVLSFMVIPSFFCELAGFPFRKWKLIIGERGSPFYNYPVTIRVIRLFHFLSDKVITNSFAKKEDTLSCSPLLKSLKVDTIYNIIDKEYFSMMNQFDFFKNKKISIVIAATFHPLKNLKNLIYALLILTKNELENVSFNWYGRGIGVNETDYIRECKQMIKENKLDNNIELHAETNEIHKVYQNADFIGLFSLNEGLPNAVCEGMACGKPIIASAVSDVPLLIEEGINGFLFNPYEPESIAKAIKKVIECTPDKMEKMGEISRQKAEKLFDRKINGDKYLSIFKQLISNNNL